MASSTAGGTKGVSCHGLFCGPSGWKEQPKLQLTTIKPAMESKDWNVEIYFLPKVTPSSNRDFCNQISRDLSVPNWFWEERGYDANGFYGYHIRHGDGSPRTIDTLTTHSRFLIKEITPDPVKDTYDWDYIGFVTWWRRTGPTGIPKIIILCFDLSKKKTEPELAKQFQDLPVTRDWLECPLGVYSVLANVVVSRFDTALWGFRKPVRDIEKNREPALSNPDDKPDLDEKTEEDSEENRRYNDMRQHYFKMHDLARHIIHETEILSVASRTLTAILRTQDELCNGKKEMRLCAQSHRSIEIAEQQICNLSLRAGAFEKRLENEIKLAFNLSAAEDNKTSKSILKESRGDSKELTKLVSSLTMIFLPASFVSGFFGMNFFDYQGATIQVSASLWMFFATAIPLTLLAVAAFWQFRPWRQREGNQQKDPEAFPFEKVLRRATTALR